MAEWWCSRMSILHATWREGWAAVEDEAGDEAFEPAEPDEPAIVADLWAGGDPQVIRRIEQIRDL